MEFLDIFRLYTACIWNGSATNKPWLRVSSLTGREEKSSDGGNTDGGEAVVQEAGLFMQTPANSTSCQEHAMCAPATVGHWFVLVTYSSN